MKKMTTNELSVAIVKARETISCPWGLALTLHERAALVSRVPWSASSITRAEARFEYWSKQFEIASIDLLECWSAELRLPEIDLKKLVGATAEELEAVTGTPPPWVLIFNEIVDLMQGKNRAIIDRYTTPGEDTNLIAMAWPWLCYASHRVRQSMVEGRAIANNHFDADHAISVFLPRLVRRLSWCLQRTCLLELNVARMRGQLSGDTAEERYHDFCHKIVRPDIASLIFQEYPVLVRLLTEETEHWIAYVSELFQRLSADWEPIQHELFDGRDIGKLQNANADAGDTHNGGRSVAILEFESGAKFVYKPRSTAGEKVFRAAVEWLNQQTSGLSLKTYRVLNRESYGWCEYVEPMPCQSPRELKHFYCRQGKLLALGFVLRMTDLYCENILAVGEHPVVVDAESIMDVMHPEDLRNPLWFALDQSLLALGLLPWPIAGPGDSVLDISGLAGGGTKMMSPFAVPVLDGNGRDDARIIHRQVPLSQAQNQPRRADDNSGFHTYIGDIIDGFAEAYRVFSISGTAFLETLSACIDGTSRFRFIPRPSRSYARVLSASTHPNLLRDALDREVLFSRLWKRATWRRALIKSERLDLWDGAIPIFVRQPDRSDLSSSCNEIISAGLPVGIDGVIDRVHRMTESDLGRHIWTIRSAFSVSQSQAETSTLTWVPQGCSEGFDFETRCLKLAEEIGRRLISLAAREKGAVNWLDVKPVGGGFQKGPTRRMELAAMGADLYSGISGMTLFFRYLAHCSHDPQLVQFANEIGQYLLWVADSFSVQAMDLGVMTGISGVLYALIHLNGVCDDGQLTRACGKCVEAVARLSGTRLKCGFDISSGSAGIICVLLGCNATFFDPKTLELAVQHGEHIVANAETMSSGVAWCEANSVPLAGFAHGTAGIAYALSQLFQVTGIEQFKEVALEAVRFERSLFDRDIHNWIDRRDWVRSSNSKPVGCVSWCTGSAGIGLSRLAMQDLLDGDHILEEIRAAFEITMNGALRSEDDCICHGTLGELEFLNAAASKVAYHRELRDISMLAEGLLLRVDREGFKFEGGVETLNLMTGLAGCGYALLRIARPQVVPSVMLLSAAKSRQEIIGAH